MNDLTKYLMRLVKDAGSQSKAAKRIGITRQFLGEIIRGKKSVSERFAKKLGFRKKIVWEKIKDANE